MPVHEKDPLLAEADDHHLPLPVQDANASKSDDANRSNNSTRSNSHFSHFHHRRRCRRGLLLAFHFVTNTAIALFVFATATRLSQTAYRYWRPNDSRDGSTIQAGAYYLDFPASCRERTPAHDPEFMTFPLRFGTLQDQDHLPSLSIVQRRFDEHEPHERHRRSIDVSGAVDFVLLAEGEQPRVDIEILTSDEAVGFDIDWKEDAQTLQLTVRDDKAYDGHGWPCLAASVTVHVPKDAKLDRLVVKTSHLKILLQSQLSLTVVEKALLNSVVSSIYAWWPLERGTPDRFDFVSGFSVLGLLDVATVTGSIDGNWNAGGSAVLQTVAGSINAYVYRRESPAKKPDASDYETGRLSVSAKSGHVRVREVHGSVQPWWSVYLETVSGFVDGHLRYEGQLVASTKQGSIRLDVTPLPLSASDAKIARLATETISGSTSVQVHGAAAAAVDGQTSPLDWLHSRHNAVSGSIHLDYPASWEGSIDLSTTSGSIQVSGAEAEEKDKALPGRHFKSHRGDRYGSELDGSTVSGGIRLVFA